jgi:hypothetical protein
MHSAVLGLDLRLDEGRQRFHDPAIGELGWTRSARSPNRFRIAAASTSVVGQMSGQEV